MEMPPPNERYAAGPASLPRWRASELLAFSPGAQQYLVNTQTGSNGDSKFLIDDSLLSDLMDLDPLCDQTGEPWVTADFPFSAFSPGCSFSPGTHSIPLLLFVLWMEHIAGVEAYMGFVFRYFVTACYVAACNVVTALC